MYNWENLHAKKVFVNLLNYGLDWNLSPWTDIVTWESRGIVVSARPSVKEARVRLPARVKETSTPSMKKMPLKNTVFTNQGIHSFQLLKSAVELSV